MTNAQLKYAQEHNLTDTLISLQVLRQCRPDLPERKEVGITSNGLRILFEETQGSLLKKQILEKQYIRKQGIIKCLKKKKLPILSK